MKRLCSLVLFLSLCLTLCLAFSACEVHINPTSWSGKYSYDNANKYTAGVKNFSTSQVKNLDIDWGAGVVLLQESDEVTEITLTETVYTAKTEETPAAVQADQVLYHWLDGNTLRIKFLQSKWNKQTVDAKTLTVLIPAGTLLGNISVDSESASVKAFDLHADRMEVDNISGEIFLTGNHLKDLECESVSGDVTAGQGEANQVSLCSVSGAVVMEKIAMEELQVETTSGSIRVWYGFTIPRASEIDSVSGKVEILIPDGIAHTITFETISGTYGSQFQETVSGKVHTFGTGGNAIRVETTSGNLTVKCTLEYPEEE